MATTVKLLTEWNGYPHNAIITLDDGTATGLVAGKIATTTTAGGVVYVPPDQPAYTVPMVAEFDPDTPSALPALKARGQTVFSAAKVAAIDAVVSKYGIAPATLDASTAPDHNGGTRSIAAGATMTVHDGAWDLLSAGIVIQVGQGGSATLAFSGTATKENASGTSASSVTLAACGTYSLMQSPTGSPRFRLTGGASL